MLKRQRPATPPPSSLGDSPFFLPDGPIRPLQSFHTEGPSQPRSKRQRMRPPPLEGVLRGFLESESTGTHWESDGEEDWAEDPYDVVGSASPPSTMGDQYKDANCFLHELHVLNQHRLLFAHSPRDRRLNSNPKTLLPSAHTHTQDPPTGQRPTAWTNPSPFHSAPSRLARDRPADQHHSIEFAGQKGLVEEVQCVRQRYEDANRLLGSLFLSRRRDVEGTISLPVSLSS